MKDVNRIEIVLSNLRKFEINTSEERGYIYGDANICYIRHNWECVRTKNKEFYSLELSDALQIDFYHEYLIDSLQLKLPLTVQDIDAIVVEYHDKYLINEDDNEFIRNLKIQYNYDLAMNYFFMNEFEMQSSLLRPLLALKPDDPEYHMRYIESLHFSGRHDEARLYADQIYDKFLYYERFIFVYEVLFGKDTKPN